MGRRKERRIAAKSAAGRRVKLDLFAEPSGDLGGSPALEEVGGDGKTHPELPNSPSSSSSGQQPHNPLLLLEQYSDEELDEVSNEGHDHAAADDALVDSSDEAKLASAKETEDIKNNAGDERSIQKEEQLLDDCSASQDPKFEEGSITGIEPDDLQRGSNTMEEATYPAEPDQNLVEDVSSGWKMVLHEESNQYYYWNIATGETSWEVPDVFAQETVVTMEKAVGDTEGKRDAVMGTYKSSTHVDMEEDDITRKLNVDCQTSDSADQGKKIDGTEGFKGDSIGNDEENRDTNHSHVTSSLCRHSGENESGTDLSSQLIKHCESLLERLHCVERLNCYLEGEDLKLKYTLETEIRLADIKALASHGSFLHPFWLHSEGRLKQLEAAIDCIDQRKSSGFEVTVESHEGIGDDIENGKNEKKALFPVAISHAPEYTDKSKFEAHNDGDAITERVPSLSYSSTYPINHVGGNSDITRIEKESGLTPTPALHSSEEEDMDVDMEVEDTFTSIKSLTVQNTLAEQEPTVPGQVFSVPTVEKWIPPPPPDNEPFPPPPPPDDEPFLPPPPPDEPPETSYPSSSTMESVQPFTYSDQYHVLYPGSSLQYYGQTNPEVPGTTLYTHSEGGQVAVPHLPHYYEAVPNVYGVAPTVVNPVEPSAYYVLQNETLNHVSLVGSATVGSSGTPSEHAPEHLGTGAAGSSLLPQTELNVIKSDHGTVKAPPKVPDAQPSIGAPAISSASDVTISDSAAAATTSKVQSKVLRGKKRAVAVVSTLRSNKKVSRLVDKWKAAKEELQEEEEEPEDAYEILEKKRQREIEEWRAHQIASGEARDNANFQPLGGDWRERVKRKRAQKKKESGQSSSDVATDGNKKPDVVELSKGLPLGWKVYLDESSKQVYYGNVLTSETTWTRPGD